MLRYVLHIYKVYTQTTISVVGFIVTKVNTKNNKRTIAIYSITF